MSNGNRRPSAKELFDREFNIAVYSLSEDEGIGGGYLKGEISIGRVTLPFRGVAFGRFGGHNINIEFDHTPSEMKLLLGLEEKDIENLRIAAQIRIVQGEINLKNKEDHKHDHQR